MGSEVKLVWQQVGAAGEDGQVRKKNLGRTYEERQVREDK